MKKITDYAELVKAKHALNKTIAPVEDGANMAGSYTTGKQFIRDGVLYTALTSIAASTAFSSLTLDTDYEVADDITSQLSSVNSALSNKQPKTLDTPLTIGGVSQATVEGALGGLNAQKVDKSGALIWKGRVVRSITADGVKTYAQLFRALVQDILNNYLPTLGSNQLLYPAFIYVQGYQTIRAFIGNAVYKTTPSLSIAASLTSFVGATGNMVFYYASTYDAADQWNMFKNTVIASDGTITYTDSSSDVPNEGNQINITFDLYESN